MRSGRSGGSARRVLVKASRLIDGSGSAPLPDGWLVVGGDGRLADVGAGRAPLDVDERIELPGVTLLPGLIDAHAHLGSLSRDASWLRTLDAAAVAARIFENCRIALSEGFTCVRDAGGLDGGVAAAVRSGLVPGPRVLPSGPALLHPDAPQPAAVPANQLPGLHVPSVAVASAPVLADAARLAFARGATQLKLIQSGSLAEEIGTDRFSVSELAAAVCVARSHGTYVMSHAFGLNSVRSGLAAGIGCFEHCFELDRRTAEQMRDRDAALVATLSILDRVAMHGEALGFPTESIRRSRRYLDGARAAIRLAATTGVAIGCGSDLIGSPQRDRGVELVRLAEQIGPLAAIVAATCGNARILGVEASLGSLQAGKAADVVGVLGDPVQDPSSLAAAERIVLVMQGGEVVAGLNVSSERVADARGQAAVGRRS